MSEDHRLGNFVTIPLTDEEYSLILTAVEHEKREIDYPRSWKKSAKELTLRCTNWGDTMSAVAMYCNKLDKDNVHREPLHRKVCDKFVELYY